MNVVEQAKLVRPALTGRTVTKPAVKSALFSSPHTQRFTSVAPIVKNQSASQQYLQRSVTEGVNHASKDSLQAADDQPMANKPWANVDNFDEHHTPFGDERRQDAQSHRYIKRVRQKVERIGTGFFPRDPYGKKAYGQVTISFTLAQDGKMTGFDIVRSSGKVGVDQGILRIVQVAQPFGYFPVSLAARTSTLTLSMTVAFIEGDRAVIS